MSLEALLAENTAALLALNETLKAGVGVSSKPAGEADPKPTKGKKAAGKTEEVKSPTHAADPVKPEEAQDDFNFGDEDDLGDGDEAPAVTAKHASCAVKAFRSAAAEKTGDKDKALEWAKQLLKATGFANTSDFTDDAAEKIVKLASDAAAKAKITDGYNKLYAAAIKDL